MRVCTDVNMLSSPETRIATPSGGPAKMRCEWGTGRGDGGGMGTRETIRGGDHLGFIRGGRPAIPRLPSDSCLYEACSRGPSRQAGKVCTCVREVR